MKGNFSLLMAGCTHWPAISNPQWSVLPSLQSLSMAKKSCSLYISDLLEYCYHMLMFRCICVYKVAQHYIFFHNVAPLLI